MCRGDIVGLLGASRAMDRLRAAKERADEARARKVAKSPPPKVEAHRVNTSFGSAFLAYSVRRTGRKGVARSLERPGHYWRCSEQAYRRPPPRVSELSAAPSACVDWQLQDRPIKPRAAPGGALRRLCPNQIRLCAALVLLASVADHALKSAFGRHVCRRTEAGRGQGGSRAPLYPSEQPHPSEWQCEHERAARVREHACALSFATLGNRAEAVRVKCRPPPRACSKQRPSGPGRPPHARRAAHTRRTMRRHARLCGPVGRVIAKALAQTALHLCKPLGEWHFKLAARQARLK